MISRNELRKPMLGLLRRKNSYLNMIPGVIDINSLGLTELYLTFDEQKKYESCKLVIEQVLQKMTANISIEEKKIYMDKILNTSIRYYEKEEFYEACIILADLQEVLQQIH